MIKHYEDFEIVITKEGDQLYADLGTAPGGRHLAQRIPITLPDDRVAWVEVCQGGKSAAELAELGHRLFEALITGELSDNWHACMGEVRLRPDTGLRLRFSLQADALTQVPLELLCQQTHPIPKFLALDALTPVVRSPRFDGSVKKRPITLPLRMLVVVANPRLQVQTDPVAEQANLEGALADLIESRELIIEYLGLPGYPKADYKTLHDALVLTDYSYDIVHFIGHGDLPDTDDKQAEGILLFADSATERRQDVRGSNLASILADNGVRLAVLQACEGARDGAHNAFQGIAQQLIARGLPAVVAMQCPVDEDVAACFCGQFYKFWLAKGGLSIERAITESRQSVYRQFGDRTSAWWTPVLFIRQESTEVLKAKMDEKPFYVQLKRGGLLLERGQINEAVAELGQAHARVPEKARLPLVRALVAQAQAREGAGDENGALAACERALHVSPNEQAAQEIKAFIWDRRGDAALERGDLDIALNAYLQAANKQKIEEVGRKKQEILEEKAVSYIQAEQWNKAAELYLRLIEETEDESLRKEWRIALNQVEEKLKTEPSGPVSASWPAGSILDKKYKIIERITTTRRCEIYKAQELRYARRAVAIKRLKPDKLEDEVARERFEREVAVLGQIEHKSVLRSLYDGRTEDGDRYFVTEFAERGSLKDYLKTRPNHKLSPLESLAIAKDVCQGLDAAHKCAIIHHDVKPGNVFLFSESNGNIRARLADFSIARVPEDWSDETLTRLIDGVPCTPQYASPEQLEFRRGDARSDLYSWAVVFFEMLTGEKPQMTLKNLVTWHPTSDEFPPSFFTERGVPQEFVEVLQKALYRDLKRRYQSANELQKDLDSIKYSIITDIKRHLGAGEEHVKASEWQAANVEFERGLELCSWYNEPDELTDQFKELIRKLRMGQLCAQGMVYKAKQQWQAAVEALEALQKLAPTYLGTDVAEELKQARSEQELESKYQRISILEEQEEWTIILRLTTDFDTDWKGPDGESIDDKRKRALCRKGEELSVNNPARAYYLLYELYKEDPDYEKVAELCAAVAFRNGTRTDIRMSWGQKVEWLEKVIEVDPNHREGRTQKQLDRARHRWAEELPGEDRYAAIAQLERISPDYNQWREAYQALVSTYCQLLRDGDYSRTERANLDAEAEARYRLGMERWGRGDLQGAVEQLAGIYPQAKEFEKSRSELGQIEEALGEQERQDGHWHKAIEWWGKALAMSPSLEKSLRWRIREARARAWLKYHGQEIVIIGLLVAILAVVVEVWQPSVDWVKPATPTPTPPTLCNGDFEDEFVCWQQGGELDRSVKCEGDQCFAVLGDPDYACGGGVPVGEAWIKQSFKVPEGMSPTLSLRYHVFSQDLSLHDLGDPNLPGYDYFQIAINGEPLQRYGNIDWNEASCEREPWDSGWQTVTLNLSAYQGQEIETSLRNVNGTDSDYNTWTYVDDVRIDEGK